MSTYTQILYQVIYSTKYIKPTLIKEDRPSLFNHIRGLLKSRKCRLYEINGTEDHLHLLAQIHPGIAPADLVKIIKLSSTKHIKETGLFPDFNGWQDGYVALTHSINAKNDWSRYIKNQEELHRTKSFNTELTELLKQHQIEVDEKYML
jgi:REP element-mobilizing transposase RayT